MLSELDKYTNYLPPYDKSFTRNSDADALAQEALNAVTIIQSGGIPEWGDAADTACRYLKIDYDTLPLEK